jgi:PAS domain S-box-containing protein
MTVKPTYEELEKRVQELEKIESEHKYSKEALRENESLFKMLYEKAPLGYQSLDENGRFLVVNQTWLETLGYTKEEVIGRSFADFLHPDWRDHFKENFPRFKSLGEILGVEFEMVKKNGNLILVSFTGKISRDNKGNFQQTHCIFHDITERKKIEEALNREHRMLARTEAVAHVGSWEWEAEGDKVTWSEELFRIFGLEPTTEAPPFTEHQAFYVPKDRVRLVEAVEECLLNSVPYDLEVSVIRTDGQLRHCVVRGFPEHGTDGRVNRLYGSLHDITERKLTEEALRESENQISSIFRSAPVGIGSVVNRVLIKVNNRLCEMTGYDETELIGQSARMLYPSDENFEFVGREKYAQIADYGTGIVETRWQKKDGTIIDVLLSSTPVDLQDQSKGVTFTALDITERRQAEEKLKMAHEKLLTILDSIDSTVYVADMDTCEILFMNKKMITVFGGDKTGDICYHAFRKNSEPCECCTNDQLVDKHGNPADVRIWDDKNPVTGRYYINYDRAIEWTDGRLVRMQIATDITDLKKMETQLNQAQKMESVGRLAGGVAHDFNNMLGVILGHTELALLHADENHDLYADLNEIQNAAKRSANLVKKLLAFARKEIISPKRLDLNDTVESMLNMLRRLIGEDIDLLWKPAAHLWSVKMDPSQIDQILANLCVNARDAIDGVGKLTIETGKKTFDEKYCKEHAGFIPGDFVMLAVSDNGCGMDKDTLDNLFEPFFTTKAVGKGTGLGLATIYGIVKQNNGFINVYSEPGQGTTFKIYLPRIVADEDIDKTVPEKKAAAGGTETILLVEDEPTILRMTRMMLGRKGYSVLPAATPGEAIALAKAHADTIHLLMTDVVMPEMNGRDLAGQITDLCPDIRLLFMSGYTSNVIAHHGVLDKGVAFIQKPFSMADMTERVREVLDMSPDKNRG